MHGYFPFSPLVNIYHPKGEKEETNENVKYYLMQQMSETVQ